MSVEERIRGYQEQLSKKAALLLLVIGMLGLAACQADSMPVRAVVPRVGVSMVDEVAPMTPTVATQMLEPLPILRATPEPLTETRAPLALVPTPTATEPVTFGTNSIPIPVEQEILRGGYNNQPGINEIDLIAGVVGGKDYRFAMPINYCEDNAALMSSKINEATLRLHFPGEVLQWRELIEERSQQSGIPANFLAALIDKESGGDAGSDGKGGFGLMGVGAAGPGKEWRPTSEELKDPRLNTSWGVAIFLDIFNDPLMGDGDLFETARWYSAGFEDLLHLRTDYAWDMLYRSGLADYVTFCLKEPTFPYSYQVGSN
jgi:hypothetical protein